MAFGTVYANPAESGAHIPFLLEVQDRLLDDLDTRVVAPLVPAASYGHPLRRLHPVLSVEGRAHVLLTQELAGVHVRALGAPVADLSGRRAEILAALDFLFTGV